MVEYVEPAVVVENPTNHQTVSIPTNGPLESLLGSFFCRARNPMP
jgi:hypothetical protein